MRGEMAGVQMTARAQFPKGSRVKWSVVGLSYVTPARPERHGTVVGWSQDNTCVTVIWDGTKTPGSIHADYLDRIEKKMEGGGAGRQER